MNPKWEKAPWQIEITRNSAGIVERVRVLAAQPRVVHCTTFKTKRNRAGFQEFESVMGSKTETHPAVVADCGITYVGLSAETLLAHGDLIAVAPELYEWCASDDANSLALHGSVHEPLFLKAVTLQGRVHNSTPDTDGRGDGVLSRDKQINVALTDGEGVPSFQIQDVRQEHRIARSDFNVLGGTH